MGLQELIEHHVTDANDDLDYLALAVFEEIINDQDLLQEIVLPVLKSAIRNRLRMLTREIERNSIVSDLRPGKSDPTADRMAFLKEVFPVPGIGFVTWAEATIEHHEARIRYLQGKVDGLTETQQRHENAIKQCKEAGVNSLGEIHGKPKRSRRKAS